MKESYVEGLAAHDGPESYVVAREGKSPNNAGNRHEKKRTNLLVWQR